MDEASTKLETRGRKPNLARRDAIARAYEKWQSLSKVAEIFNISRQRVSKIVQAAKRGEQDGKES